MPSLHETQAVLMASLLHGDGVPGAAALLRPTRGISAARRLQVYRHNVHASLGAALAAVHPVVEKLVGEAFFRQVARRYVDRHPSRSGNLHAFGDRFGEFLRGHAPVSELPYLADVAALEWAVHEVYHEADGEPLDPSALAGVPADAAASVRLHLPLASRFVASPFPVLAIWQANQDGAAEPATPLSLDAGGARVLVARRGFEVEFRELGRAEDCWLRCLGEGRTLEVALASALALDPAFDFAAALARHLAAGSFHGWSLADPGSAS